MAQAQEWRIPAAPVEDVAERLACPQLAARGFWVEVEVDGRRVRTPRVPYLVEGVEPVVRGPLVERATLPPMPATPRERHKPGAIAGDGLPFSGVRVLDLTHFWSGPSATMTPDSIIS